MPLSRLDFALAENALRGALGDGGDRRSLGRRPQDRRARSFCLRTKAHRPRAASQQAPMRIGSLCAEFVAFVCVHLQCNAAGQTSRRSSTAGRHSRDHSRPRAGAPRPRQTRQSDGVRVATKTRLVRRFVAVSALRSNGCGSGARRPIAVRHPRDRRRT